MLDQLSGLNSSRLAHTEKTPTTSRIVATPMMASIRMRRPRVSDGAGAPCASVGASVASVGSVAGVVSGAAGPLAPMSPPVLTSPSGSGALMVTRVWCTGASLVIRFG